MSTGWTAQIATIIHSPCPHALCNWLYISSQQGVECVSHPRSLGWPCDLLRPIEFGSDRCFHYKPRTQEALLLFIFLGLPCEEPGVACWTVITWNTTEAVGQSQLRSQRYETVYPRSAKPAGRPAIDGRYWRSPAETTTTQLSPT